MRRSFAFVLEKSGLPGTPAPVSGSIRITAPLSPSGSEVERKSCERSLPPSAVGGDIGRRAARRVAAGIGRVAALAVVGEREARSLPARVVEVAVRAELEPAAGVARVLLAPVLDQDLLGTGHRLAAHLQARDAPAHHASVRGAAGRGRAGSEVWPGWPQRGAVPPIAASCT